MKGNSTKAFFWAVDHVELPQQGPGGDLVDRPAGAVDDGQPPLDQLVSRQRQQLILLVSQPPPEDVPQLDPGDGGHQPGKQGAPVVLQGKKTDIFGLRFICWPTR